MKTHNEILDELGGTTAVARIFGITEGAVSQWRATEANPGACIPKVRLMYLEVKYPELFTPTPSGVTASPSAQA